MNSRYQINDDYAEGVTPYKADYKIFGHIPGVPVGAVFDDRRQCSLAGVHAPLRAGISGSVETGAYSVVVSGGYVDDKDEGNVVIYTGSGGRKDLNRLPGRVASFDPPQTHDQTWSGANKALLVSRDRRQAVRLVRGEKGNTKWAPISGYRYDGLYDVVDAWQETGKDGFKMCKFRFVRQPNQPELRPQHFNTYIANTRSKKTKKKAPATQYAPVDTSRAGIRVVRRDPQTSSSPTIPLAPVTDRTSIKRQASRDLEDLFSENDDVVEFFSSDEEKAHEVIPASAGPLRPSLKRIRHDGPLDEPRRNRARIPTSPIQNNQQAVPRASPPYYAPSTFFQSRPRASNNISDWTQKSRGLKRTYSDAAKPDEPKQDADNSAHERRQRLRARLMDGDSTLAIGMNALSVESRRPEQDEDLNERDMWAAVRGRSKYGNVGKFKKVKVGE